MGKGLKVCCVGFKIFKYIMVKTYQDAVQAIITKQEELKAAKKALRDIESDLPMELEDLMISFKDLQKQVKAAKEDHIKSLLSDNTDYVELREKIQELKEEEADGRVQLFTLIQNATREHQSDLDETVLVEGAPCRLQTQRDLAVYLNGKVLK